MNTQILLHNKKELSNEITMSSREIAELICKNHSDICRSISRLIEKGIIGGYQPMAYTHSQNGQTYYEFHLNKRDSFVVVAQNSPEFTAAVIDRWQELEAQVQQSMSKLPDFTNPAEAARAWATEFEEKQALRLDNQQKAVQIESMESYFRNGISPFEFVKGLNGVNSLKVGEFLVSRHWLYQSGDVKRVASYARDRYLTEETTEISQHGKAPFMAYKPVLLKKGAAKLYAWYVAGELPMKKNWNTTFTQDKAVGL